jgi:casein kinase 1
MLTQPSATATSPMGTDRRKDAQQRNHEVDRKRLAPGKGTNSPAGGASAAAQVNVPVGSGNNRQHPYAAGGYNGGGGLGGVGIGGAAANNGGRLTPNGGGSDEMYGPGGGGSAAYGRVSPMLPNAAAVTNVSRAHAHGDIGQDGDMPRPKNTLWNILTCRCG